jgi:hypothetical protein
MTVMEQDRPIADTPLIDGWLAAWNIETALYVLVGLVAFALRVVNLGDRRHARHCRPGDSSARPRWRPSSRSARPGMPSPR